MVDFEGDISYRLCGQAPEPTKNVILEFEPQDVRRRGIFGGKQPGVEINAGFGGTVLELAKKIPNPR